MEIVTYRHGDEKKECSIQKKICRRNASTPMGESLNYKNNAVYCDLLCL